ncbi:sporulation protein YpjB [Aquibacillus saliphilus]|uniref:sporulation protein YpjB n=1 Tax=Aquibacillus saliphilus TaxID=1909422 RepID=UPI001CF08A9E
MKTVFAHHTNLSDTIHQYERFLQEERFDTANSLLANHKEEILKFITDDVPDELQMEFLSLLDDNISNGTVDNNTKKKQALSLILAIDSVNNSNSPIWMKWKKSTEDSISAMLENKQVTDEKIIQVISNWDTMSLAMEVVLSEEQYIQLEQSYMDLDSESNGINNFEQLEVVYNEMNNAVINDEENEKDGLTFGWMILIVGGFITLTLTYVGWQKYKYDKKKRQKQTLN